MKVYLKAFLVCQFMERYNLSYEEFAKKCKMNQTSLRKILNKDKKCNYLLLRKIANGMEVSPTELMYSTTPWM